MNETYKEHEILASAWQAMELPEAEVWEPAITITCSKGSQCLNRLPNVTKNFFTREDAEAYGMEFAKKWIDDGNPPLSYDGSITK